MKFQSSFFSSFRRVSPVFSLIFAMTGMGATAQTFVWVGDTDKNLATPENWEGKAVPVAEAQLIFNKAGSKGTDLVNGLGKTVMNVVFGKDSSNFTFSGGSLQLTGNITNSSSVARQTLQMPVVLGDSTHIFRNEGGEMSINSDITSAKPINGAFFFTGPGMTKLGGRVQFSSRSRMGGLHVKEGGTLEITGSTTVAGTGTLGGNAQIGSPGSSLNRLIISKGGSLSVNGSLVSPQHGVSIGVASQGELTLNGGSLAVHHEEALFHVGHTWNNRGTGILNINGDSHVMLKTGKPRTEGHYLVIGSGSAEGIVNLNGGVLETGRTLGHNGVDKNPKSGSGTFNFNGGILKAAGDNNDWFASAATPDAIGEGWIFPLTKVSVKEGGAKIDSNGFNVSLNAVLVHDEGLGAGPDGGLVKTGAGTLTLAGENTYTGENQVQKGVLMINNTAGSGTGKGEIKVAKGAVLGGAGSFEGKVTIATGGTLSPGNNVQGLTGGSLTLEKGAVYSAELDSSAIQGTQADLYIATGDLNIAEGAELEISDVARSATAFPVGQVITLVNYTQQWDRGVFTYKGKPLIEGSEIATSHNTWVISYKDTTGGSNFTAKHKGGNFVNIKAVTQSGGGASTAEADAKPASSNVAAVSIVGGVILLISGFLFFSFKRRSTLKP